METENGTLEAYLAERLCGKSGPGNRFEEELGGFSENFAIRPLPQGITDDQIIEAVRSFYESRGYTYNPTRSSLDWWAVLFFEKPDEKVQATLSTYPVFGIGPGTELMVTTTQTRRKN